MEIVYLIRIENYKNNKRPIYIKNEHGRCQFKSKRKAKDYCWKHAIFDYEIVSRFIKENK